MIAATRNALSRVLLEPLLATLFPCRCAGCQASLRQPTLAPLCANCWRSVPRHPGPLCGCGWPLPAGIPGPCGRCRRGLSVFGRGFSFGPYSGTLRDLVLELKYRNRRRVAERFAELIESDPQAAEILADGGVLVPVPLHPRRCRERGFNQSELLATALAGRSRLPIAPRALVRRRDTATQTGLSAAQRRENVRGAFAIRDRAKVAGRIVVLVDDVLTTGATVRECAAALLEAGARSVRVLTVARVV